MAACKRCGRWAGVAIDEHPACADAALTMTDEQIKAANTPIAAAPSPVTVWTIALGVFLGLCSFSLFAGIAYGVLRLLS